MVVPPIILATHAMATRFELVIIPSESDDPHHLQAAGEEALQEVELWHHRLNFFAPDSLITRINRLAATQSVRVDDETFELLARCQQLNRDTQGAFDISIAQLLRAFGLRGTDGVAQRGSTSVPKLATGFELDDVARTIRFTSPATELDMGGVGKGWAIDCAVAILREHNVTCALLHGGTSTACAIGAPPGQTGWGVQIKDGPTITLCDQALSVSALNSRIVTHDGIEIAHIIDPRDGVPLPATTLQQHVIMQSAADADAWSTARLVLAARCGTNPA